TLDEQAMRQWIERVAEIKRVVVVQTDDGSKGGAASIDGDQVNVSGLLDTKAVPIDIGRARRAVADPALRDRLAQEVETAQVLCQVQRVARLRGGNYLRRHGPQDGRAQVAGLQRLETQTGLGDGPRSAFRQ